MTNHEELQADITELQRLYEEAQEKEAWKAERSFVPMKLTAPGEPDIYYYIDNPKKHEPKPMRHLGGNVFIQGVGKFKRRKGKR